MSWRLLCFHRAPHRPSGLRFPRPSGLTAGFFRAVPLFVRPVTFLGHLPSHPTSNSSSCVVLRLSFLPIPPLPSLPFLSFTCSCAKLDYGTAQRIIDGRISLDMAAADDIAAGRSVDPSAALAVAMEDGEDATAADAVAAGASGDASAAVGSAGAASAVTGGIPADLWDPKRRPPLTRKPGAAAAAVYDAEGAGLPQQTCAGIVRDVRMMHAIAMARRRKRFAAGALALHRGKLTLALDGAGNPVGVTTYPIYDSNRVVEEFMLL